MQENNQAKPPSVEALKQQWNSKAKYYQDTHEKTTFIIAATLANMLEISKAKHIFEMACGSGGFSLYFLKTFNNVETYTACDISEEMISLANANKTQAEGLSKETKHEFVVANAEDLSFIKDESIDVYISNLGINFVPDTNKALQEAKRVLKKGAKIGLSVPVLEKGSLFEVIFSTFLEANMKLPEGRSPYHLSTKETLIKVLQENGFEVNYCWDGRSSYPCNKESDIDYFLNGGDFGPFYRQFDEETQKTIREKVLKEFAKMKEGYIAPFLGALSIVATKP